VWLRSILMIRHDRTGAMGVAINRVLEERTLKSLLEAVGEKDAAATIPLTVIAELSCAMLILLIVGFLGLTAPMAM